MRALELSRRRSRSTHDPYNNWNEFPRRVQAFRAHATLGLQSDELYAHAAAVSRGTAFFVTNRITLPTSHASNEPTITPKTRCAPA